MTVIAIGFRIGDGLLHSKDAEWTVLREQTQAQQNATVKSEELEVRAEDIYFARDAKVAARTVVGWGDYSALCSKVRVTKPTAPRGMKAEVLDDVSIRFAWAAVEHIPNVSRYGPRPHWIAAPT